MTDSNDPTKRRRRPGREPPTIDLKATVMEEAKEVSEGKAAGEPAEQSAGEPETARAEAGPEIAAREAGAPPEAAGESADVGPTAPVSDADMAGLKPDETVAGETPPPAAESEAERPSPPLPPQRQGPGYGGLILAALLGGVAGAALLAAFEAWRPNVLPPDPRVTALEQRIAGLPRPDAVQGLTTRIGSVESAQNALAQRVQEAQSLAEQAAAQAREAAGQAQEAASQAQTATGQAKEALDRPVAPPETDAAVTELGNRVKALEEASAATASLGERIRALEESGGAVKDLGSRLDSLEAQLRENGQAAMQAAQSTTTALQGLDKRVSDLDQRLTALNRQIAEGGSEAIRAGTRVVLASRLTDALKSGAPFPEVLSALTRFNADPNRLEALAPMAEKGAPTAAALARGFEPLAAQILREEQGGSDSWADRLTRMAEKVVTVRPVDQPESTGVPALVARIRNALDRGAFEDAAAAWDMLPEPARRLSQDWGQQLKQRAAAEAAARAIAADAVAALNPSTR